VIYRIIFTEAASRDLDEIGDYLEAMAGSEVAERFVEEVIETAETLRTIPVRQHERRELGAGLRSIRVRSYMIFYRVDGDAVSILRVLHGSRNITSKLFPPDKR
jgi:toxin ParE1/3/4